MIACLIIKNASLTSDLLGLSNQCYSLFSLSPSTMFLGKNLSFFLQRVWLIRLLKEGLTCIKSLNLPELSVHGTRLKHYNSPSFPSHPLRGWRTPLSSSMTVRGGIPSPIPVSLIVVSATTSRGLVLIPPPPFLAVVAPIPRLFATVVAPFATKLVPATSFIMFLVTVRHF